MPSASPSAPTLARRLPAAALWLVGGRILGSVCTFGVLWQLARRLDLEPFGRLTFYLAVLAVMGSLVDLGTGATIVQESSRHPERLAGLLRTGRRVRLACAAVGTALWTTWALFAARADVPWVFASGAVCLSYSLELVAIPARNRMHLRGPVLVRAATSLATLLAITVCLQLGVRAVGPLLFAWSASAAAGHVALYILLRHELPDRAPAAAWRPFLRAALPLGIAALCQQLYFWVDNVFIRSAYGEDQLGLYNLPVRLFSFAIWWPYWHLKPRCPGFHAHVFGGTDGDPAPRDLCPSGDSGARRGIPVARRSAPAAGVRRILPGFARRHPAGSALRH
ncbi:MAG: oligosaccharide flippase family protein [Planctomycetota bacterium]